MWPLYATFCNRSIKLLTRFARCTGSMAQGLQYCPGLAQCTLSETFLHLHSTMFHNRPFDPILPAAPILLYTTRGIHGVVYHTLYEFHRASLQ